MRINLGLNLNFLNMSHSSKIFDSAPVQVQNRNGFDLSHLNCGTSKCGQLVPVLTKLLPPNTDFSLGLNMEVNLPPLVSTFYGRIDAIVEGFVIPCSILYGGWKQFITNNPITSKSSVQDGVTYTLPYLAITDVVFFARDIVPKIMSNDLLFDYFGLHLENINSEGLNYLKFNLLPFLAYHLIWDTFYRNKQITKTIFDVNPNIQTDEKNAKRVSLIWHSFYTSSGVNTGAFTPGDGSMSVFPDGVPVYQTRQRNYARDYFTAAVPSPQQGNASRLNFTVTSGTGEFTISALRAANSLQKFLETNNLSQDYAEMMRNRWGTRPIDADFDEPYYLGRVVVPVYQKGVYNNTPDGPSSGESKNPFILNGALGSKAATAGFNGEGSITRKYHNTTWSYVMCLFSLVPHAQYGLGMNREMTMVELGDFPSPEFQSIGYEEILKYEVDAGDPFPTYAFGYIPRYSRFKYIDDTVHGELKPMRSLESFVLQRNIEGVELGTDFLEIGQNDLDGILAVDTDQMSLSCWYEIFFDFKVVMPLADFCIPTLGDIRDTHTIKTSVGGSRL